MVARQLALPLSCRAPQGPGPSPPLCRFVLFLLCGILYDEMIDHAISAFQTLYFLTSFFNQFGPNCTSFLVAGEARPIWGGGGEGGAGAVAAYLAPHFC